MALRKHWSRASVVWPSHDKSGRPLLFVKWSTSLFNGVIGRAEQSNSDISVPLQMMMESLKWIGISERNGRKLSGSSRGCQIPFKWHRVISSDSVFHIFYVAYNYGIQLTLVALVNNHCVDHTILIVTCNCIVLYNVCVMFALMQVNKIAGIGQWYDIHGVAHVNVD